MRTLVTGRKMKEIDAYTIENIGIPSMVLMERAACAVTAEMRKRVKPGAVIWAVCGAGNNGADGVAAARMLYLLGFLAQIVLVAHEEKGTPELKAQLAIARRIGVPVCSWKDLENTEKPEPKRCDGLIDAIFGVGLGREIEGDYRACMEMLTALLEGQTPPVCVAVDIPSGISSDKGTVMGIALPAAATVTFGWEKMGTALYPGRAYAGEVVVDSIGFPAAALKQVQQEAEDTQELRTALACEACDLERIPVRKAHSNKGTFGRVLIAAGSKNMSGAAYLSALAAYRTGAGLVKILTVEENRPVLQTLLPEAIIVTYTVEQILQGREEFKKNIEEQMNWADVVVLGPGLGSEPYTEYLVEDILTSAYVPVIIDADGLNAISSHPYLTSYYTENIIITPHLGEMARLTGQSVSDIQADLAATALNYAARYGITCVLKDAATVVAGKEGQLYINASGTSAMAKAGSGDVLTGAVAGLLAIGMEVEEAAYMAVYLHGLAGERIAEKGMHSLLATELADALGPVMENK